MRLVLAVLTSICLCTSAQAAEHAGSPEQRADIPELAQRGPNPVGFRRVEVVDPQRVDFQHSDIASGKVTMYDRRLYVTVWYPAASGDPKT